MNPEIWGPHAWFFLHSVTFAYPRDPTPEEKEQTKQFFESLQHVLPCIGCRHNYRIHTKNNPLTDDKLTNTETLSRWLIDIHNEVNKQHGKKVYTFDEVVAHYKQEYNTPKTKTTSTLSKVLLIVVCVIIIIALTYLSTQSAQ